MKPKKITTPLKAIRAKCLDCSGDSAPEVKLCVIPHCPLFEFRMGKNPYRKELTEEERMKRTAHFRKKETS